MSDVTIARKVEFVKATMQALESLLRERGVRKLELTETYVSVTHTSGVGTAGFGIMEALSNLEAILERSASKG